MNKNVSEFIKDYREQLDEADKGSLIDLASQRGQKYILEALEIHNDYWNSIRSKPILSTGICFIMGFAAGMALVVGCIQ